MRKVTSSLNVIRSTCFVWLISRALSLSALSCILETYNEFSIVHSWLPSQQNSWLPNGYKLPENLLADITDSEEHLVMVKKKIEDYSGCGAKTPSSNVTDRTSVTLCEIPDLGGKVLIELLSFFLVIKFFLSVIVDRNSLPNILTDTSKEETKIATIPMKKWKKMVDTITTSTQNPDSLGKFINDESGHRKRDRKTALTKSLSQDQWKEMRSQLKDLLSEITNTKSSEKTLPSAKLTILYWLADPSFKGSKPKCWDANYSQWKYK